MQKTLVTFSLTLKLKVRILDISKLSRNAKRYLIKQNFNVEKSEKKFTCELFDYMFVDLEY